MKYINSLILVRVLERKDLIRSYNQILSVAGIVLVVGIALYYLSLYAVNAVTLVQSQTSFTTSLVQNGNTQNHFIIDKSQFKRAPEFSGITGFVNAPGPISLADLKGKVVLVHFWTYICINCIHTIPHLNDWYQKYSNKGLVIIGVQTPEFSDEKNIDNVKTAVNNFQIRYPVILDNNYANWNAYGNNYWPRDYLVDNQGYIRYSHIGEGDYDQTEQMILTLLGEGVIP